MQEIATLVFIAAAVILVPLSIVLQVMMKLGWL
jgi:hypothetical protein